MPNILLAILLLSISVAAQDQQINTDKPLLRHRTLDRKFMVATAISFAATAFDAHSTHSCLARNPYAREWNPLLGSHPSAVRVDTTLFGVAAGQTIVSFFQKKHRSKDWMLFPIINTGVHTFAESWNTGHCGW